MGILPIGSSSSSFVALDPIAVLVPKPPELLIWSLGLGFITVAFRPYICTCFIYGLGFSASPPPISAPKEKEKV